MTPWDGRPPDAENASEHVLADEDGLVTAHWRPDLQAWLLDLNGALVLPSEIAKNCRYVRPLRQAPEA